MRFVIVVSVLLGLAFFTGVFLTLVYPRLNVSKTPTMREYTPDGNAVVPTGTEGASILGSITINGPIPTGATMNVEARKAGSGQYVTVLQNVPAQERKVFSYTKATSGVNYDMKVTLLDPSSRVVAESSVQTVSAPSLNVQFSITIPSATQSAEVVSSVPTPTVTATEATPTAAILATPTPTATTSAISGNISFHGQAPINSRIVVFEQLANGSGYTLAADNITPIDGTLWQWAGASPGKSYIVIAVLKQKQSDGSDQDIATSAPVTVTAPASFVVLTVNSYYTLTKPVGAPSVTCVTYNSGPNQNTWNVTVNFPSYSGAQSYWLEVGSTAGGSDIVNIYGPELSVSTVFNNNTAYYARYAYAAVAGVDTSSGEFSVFSDATKLSCGN